MDVQEAAESLTPSIRREVNWFVDEGQKHFVDPVSLGVIAWGLVKLFATAAATAGGTEAGKIAVDYVRDLIAGHRKIEDRDVEKEVVHSREILANLPPADATARLEQAQAGLADGFAGVMPRGRAEGLASEIRAAATPLLQVDSAG